MLYVIDIGGNRIQNIIGGRGGNIDKLTSVNIQKQSRNGEFT